MEDQLEGWSKSDKLVFYNALRLCGSQSISDIHDYMPNKTKEEIQEAMTYFKNKALKQEKDCIKGKERSRADNSPHIPLNSWAKVLVETFPYKDLRTETATALRLIADFEDIPQPVCTEKIDFRKVYHTLANALEGKALCDDKHVAAVIDKCIIETALTSKAFMKCSSFKNAIKDIRINERNVNPFIKPTENNELSVIRHILMLTNYNPMNISEEHLKISMML